MKYLRSHAHWKDDMTADEKSMNRRERLEGWMYAIEMLSFFIGAFMFLPEVYELGMWTVRLDCLYYL